MIILAQTTLFELLKQGGWAMFPLGGLSLTLFGLMLFTWIQTSRSYYGSSPSRWVDQPLVRQLEARLNQQPQASEASRCEEIDTFLGSVEGNTLRWIQYMNVIATIAPMVGLLGTVSGMIGAFQTIASGGMGKPELLAGDIGEALITTATGLTIGIPAMVFYFIARNRLEARLEELGEGVRGKKVASQGPD